MRGSGRACSGTDGAGRALQVHVTTGREDGGHALQSDTAAVGRIDPWRVSAWSHVCTSTCSASRARSVPERTPRSRARPRTPSPGRCRRCTSAPRSCWRTPVTALDERPDTAARRRRRPPGATVWLTGLPSAGKTTLATALAARLRERGVPAVEDARRRRGARVPVEGPRLQPRGPRHQRPAHRLGRRDARQARRAGAGQRHQPVRRHPRRASAALHGERGATFLEVHVATPVEVCSERDVKGLYARQRAGELHRA